MKVKFLLLAFILLSLFTIPTTFAETNNISLQWGIDSEIFQGTTTTFDIFIHNDGQTTILAESLIFHYSWMPPNSFVVSNVDKIVYPNQIVTVPITIAIPNTAKVETTSDFACYLKYKINDTQAYTDLIRPPAITISPSKSIYVKQILDPLWIAYIVGFFIIVAGLVFIFKTKLAQAIYERKKYIPLAIFLITFLVYCTCVQLNYASYLNVFPIQGFSITGDEPHYIMATNALLSGKTDTDSIYLDSQLKRHVVISNGTLNYGQEIFNHPIGLPLISVPAYFLGKTLLNSGTEGVLFFICALTAVISVLIYKISMFVTRDDFKASLLTTSAFSFASMLFMWSGQFFTENVLGFFIILAVYKLLTANSRNDMLSVGVILGVMPFIKYQMSYIVIVCVILFAFLYFRKMMMLKYAIVPMFILLALYYIYIFLFVGLNTTPMLGSYPDLETFDILGFKISKVLYINFFALFLDRNYGLLIYSPIILLSVLGFSQMSKKRSPGIYLAALIPIVWTLVISCFTSWNGWISIPGKYMVMILPCLCVPFALGVKDFLKYRIYQLAFAGLFLLGLISNMIIAINRVFGYVVYSAAGLDYSWFISGLEDLGISGSWTPEFLNWRTDPQLIVLYTGAFLIFTTIMLHFSTNSDKPINFPKFKIFIKLNSNTPKDDVNDISNDQSHIPVTSDSDGSV